MGSKALRHAAVSRFTQQETLISIRVFLNKQVIVLNPFSVTSLHPSSSNLTNLEHPLAISISPMSSRSPQFLTDKDCSPWQRATPSSCDPMAKQIL
ncbi:hypothetical protein Lal_00034715 [Lupinus albus]|nr:hypothetical protein Lal_00034715 [Lupinus albus]